MTTGKRKQSFRASVYKLFEGRTRLSKRVHFFVMAMILLSFVSVVFETYGDLGKKHAETFFILEAFFIGLFTVEYTLRLWSCTAASEYAHPVFGRLRYAAGFFSLVDLIAILPFYLAFAMHGVDLRALRLFRLLRVFKLLRHFEAANILLDVVRRKRQELILSASLVVVLLLISSSLVYVAENQAQPQVFSSIPVTMWWSIETLSTVGYGDMTPVTVLGRLLGGIIAVLGIGMFALPAGILAQGLSEAMQDSIRHKRKGAAEGAESGQGAKLNFCPHCGERLQGPLGD